MGRGLSLSCAAGDEDADGNEEEGEGGGGTSCAKSRGRRNAGANNRRNGNFAVFFFIGITFQSDEKRQNRKNAQTILRHFPEKSRKCLENL